MCSNTNDDIRHSAISQKIRIGVAVHLAAMIFLELSIREQTAKNRGDAGAMF
jgi:hypothetical protein